MIHKDTAPAKQSLLRWLLSYLPSDRSIPRSTGTGGGGAVGTTCPHNSGAVEAVPPQLFTGLGTVWAAVVPKLGVVGRKGKRNGRKHCSEKSPSFIVSAAHLALGR